MKVVLWSLYLCGALAPSGEIAYVEGAGTPASEVRVLDVESGATKPVGPGQWDGAPRWSPDGAWICFETGSGDSRSVYVVRADGTDGRVLTHQHAWNVLPRWSTDSTRVVYGTAVSAGALGGIAVYDLNTGEEQAWGQGRPGIVRPVWMPFSKLMAALDPRQSLEVPGVDMGRIRSEGRFEPSDIESGVLPDAVIAVQLLPGGKGGRGLASTVVLVTENEVLPFLYLAEPDRPRPSNMLWQVEPNWEDFSYDFSTAIGQEFGAYGLDDRGETTRFAYESNEGGDREIIVLRGKGFANVTNHRAADWNPVWSPDGRRIAFESFRGGLRGVYHAFTDTAVVSGVSPEGVEAWSPAWSPDGDWIVYVSGPEGYGALFVATDKGKDTRRLTDEGIAPAWPAWRPESKQ
jgi:dipeptidyl aminopeptidase/acylaminoacyl peptidase